MKCSKSLLQQSQPSGEASLKKEGYIQVVAQQMEIGPGISQSFLQTNPKETSKLPYYTNQIIQRQWLEIVDTHTHTNYKWVFPKIGVPHGTTKSSILIGFSIIFTIHFGGFPPIFGNTQITKKRPLQIIAVRYSLLLVKFRNMNYGWF